MRVWVSTISGQRVDIEVTAGVTTTRDIFRMVEGQLLASVRIFTNGEYLEADDRPLTGIELRDMFDDPPRVRIVRAFGTGSFSGASASSASASSMGGKSRRDYSPSGKKHCPRKPSTRKRTPSRTRSRSRAARRKGRR